MAGANVDFKGLERFLEKLKKLDSAQIDRFNEQAVKELAGRLLEMVIDTTPVGEYDKLVEFVTADGTEVSFTPKTGKKGGTLRRGWTIGNVTKVSGGYSADVINPIEYAPYVEYGHRTANHKGWVAGKFMMTRATSELEKNAPLILERKLKRLFAEVFKD